MHVADKNNQADTKALIYASIAESISFLASFVAPEKAMATRTRRISRPSSDSQSTFQKQRYTLIVLFAAFLCLFFTIFFVYNSSIQHPFSTKMILAQPERSILVLNILSQITILLLGWLTCAALEAVRWARACSPTGTSTYTFLVLSSATSIFGVLRLLVSKEDRQEFRRGGHRVWGCQRYFSVLCPGLTQGYFL
jgi:hypothetical protein